MRFFRGATPTLLTIAFTLAAALPADAQKKVTVGGRPAPGQTIRLNIVQDAEISMKPAEAAAGSPMGPMHLKAKTSTVVSQKVGAPDEKGGLKVDMTYEEISQNVTVNDQPAPPEAAEAAAAMKGKTLTLVVDANGEVVEVTSPPDFPLQTAALKEMMKQALGLMPKQDIAIGEAVTSPFQMPMPIPVPGADPPQLKGELKTTLNGVSGAAGSEVAALTQAVTAAVDATVEGPQGNGNIAIKMQMTGNGTTDWDLKGSLVKGSRMTTQFNGTITVPGIGVMALTGTTSVTLDRVP